ncbi:ImmA/IrrE family metallo-endopeptidase [Paenibacillus macquariensis]|uniref:IrrE N-terminal-like domain-containing protein n=1 Tax=Paenibacillus macquariensis TaxID=948756 RepID=A0ABY1JS39_9BACL|nr:ImmA/IrrE family metallo-endopeptidase [Paenibacillus macquariensis]SIQ67584.1 protein of unknown function [Paenibacillus macquariensis]
MYDVLLQQADPVKVFEMTMPTSVKGLYTDGIIWINKNLSTLAAKRCVLAEELGHHHTSYGDILDQDNVSSVKQEKRAREWAYVELVPIKAFVEAHKLGIRNKYELADHIDVTEEFLDESIEFYQRKFGNCTTYNKKYIIYLEPLGVLELFE